MAVHKGSWLGLPDFGITEAVGKILGSPQTSSGGSNVLRPLDGPTNGVRGQVLSAVAPTPSVSNSQAPQYGPTYGGQQKSMSTGIGSTGQSTAQSGSLNTLNNDVQNQLSGGLNNVDSDYQNYLSTLDTQQGNIQRSAQSALGAIDVNAQQARSALQNESVNANQAYDTQAQTANKQANTSLQNARDLYRQLQQQNVAQLSGSGISSSSVAEALAENLGVETARRIAGVTGSRDEVLNNIAKERTNTENYVKQRISDLENQVGQQKAEIQTKLLNSIDQINNARNVAANDRASRRQELILNAQNQIAQLQAKAQDFAQSLETWKAQNNAKLQNTAVSFDDLTKAMQAAGQLFGANYNIAGNGASTDNQYSGAYQINPQQKQQEDLLNQILPIDFVNGAFN